MLHILMTGCHLPSSASCKHGLQGTVQGEHWILLCRTLWIHSMVKKMMKNTRKPPRSRMSLQQSQLRITFIGAAHSRIQ